MFDKRFANREKNGAKRPINEFLNKR